MDLLDVLDINDIQLLLEQQSRHECQLGVSVCRSEMIPWRWYVYVKGKEHHCHEDPTAEPKAYSDLIEAFDVAYSPANHEKWGLTG